MKNNSFLHLTLILLAITMFSFSTFAQGGSGDLPVPKTSSKSKPKTAPKAKTAVKSPTKTATAKEPSKVEPINFDKITEGKIDAATAGRMPPSTYYQEYILNATDADLFTMELKSSNQELKLEVEDKNKNPLPLKREASTGDYRISSPDFTLPESGEYRIKVLASLNAAPSTPIQYTLKFYHIGLTAEGYQTRLQQIISAFNLPGERKIDETISQLERLAQDDDKKSGAFEYLGMLYNEYKQDTPRAATAMLQAIKLGGAATFKITHDNRWRRPVVDKKLKKLVWQEQRTNWLKISAKQIVITEFTSQDKTVIALNSIQIKEVERFAQSPFASIKHTNKTVKPELLGIAFSSPAEADMAVDLIKGNLLRKE